MTLKSRWSNSPYRVESVQRILCVGTIGGIFMKNFEYVSKKEYGPVKEELIKLIHLVQGEVREHFTFRYDFIGSASRNMITREVGGNVGYDFDVNIRINDPEEEYSAEELRRIMKDGFDKHNSKFSYDYTEDSSRVLTIKVKDKKNKKILHSCDFAIVFDCSDGRQQYVRFNKNQQSYSWDYQPKGFYQLDERIADIKEYGYWKEVRDLYIEKKNRNQDHNKKSRSIFAETVKEIHDKHFE